MKIRKTLAESSKSLFTRDFNRALEGIRTPNLLIRSQMLYPLSYERPLLSSAKRSICVFVAETKLSNRSPK